MLLELSRMADGILRAFVTPVSTQILCNMCHFHYSDIITGAMMSQITCVAIVYSDTDKKNIQATCHWPLWREFTVHRWIPRTQRASNAENVSIWWRHHVEGNSLQTKNCFEQIIWKFLINHVRFIKKTKLNFWCIYFQTLEMYYIHVHTQLVSYLSANVDLCLHC